MATKKRRQKRIGIWKKDGKGAAYTSQYVYGADGKDRFVVLTTILKNGNVKTYKAESTTALRKLGWVKVK